MVCNKCNNIISESALTCPYCGNRIVEDYFGYQKANDAIKIQQSRPVKKDNSGKIVLIVLSAVGGFFALICMLLVAFSGVGGSGSGSYSSGLTYDAEFEVNNSFVIAVNDSNSGNYNVAVRSASTQKTTDTFQLAAGESTALNYSNGIYDIMVMKGAGDHICLQMTVSDSSSLNDVNIDYDNRKIIVIGAEGSSGVYDVNQQTVTSETTTAPVIDDAGNNGMQNNGNSASSSQNNTTGTFYALTGKVIDSDIENDTSISVSYSKIQDGYKMVIRETNCDETITTAYFTAEKLLKKVEIDCMGSVSTRTFNYNSNNQLISEFSDYGSDNKEEFKYTYDNDGNLIKKYRSGDNAPAFERVYEYDPAGNLTKAYYNYPYSLVTEYEYSDGMVTHVKNTDNGSLNYEEYYNYNSELQVVSMRTLSYGNGTLQQETRNDYSYENSELMSVSGMFWEYGMISGTPTSKSYIYDSNGKVSTIRTDGRYSYTEKFTYTPISTDYMYLLNEYCLKMYNCHDDYYFYGKGVSWPSYVY